MITVARGLADVAALAATDDVFSALHQAFRAKAVGDGTIRHCVHFGVPRHPVLLFEGFLDIEHDKELGTRFLPVEVEFEKRLEKLGRYGVREIRDEHAPVQFVIRWLPNALPAKKPPAKYAAAFERFYSSR